MSGLKRLALFVVLLGFTSAVVVAAYPGVGNADRDRGKRQGYEDSSRGKDHGNEFTGQTAAWLFGAANVPAALGLLSRALIARKKTPKELADKVRKANRTQKSYLMQIHYFLNPLAIGIALTHFTLSTCRRTAIPEWGLILFALIVLLGLVLKFKLAPLSMRKFLYKLHTSPIPIAVAVTILVIGHSIVD